MTEPRWVLELPTADITTQQVEIVRASWDRAELVVLPKGWVLRRVPTAGPPVLLEEEITLEAGPDAPLWALFVAFLIGAAVAIGAALAVAGAIP